MIKFALGFSFFLSIISFAEKSPADFGYRHLQLNYKSDLVDVIVASQKGEEEKPKPLFLFCQGSLPVPAIVYDETGASSPFPFSTDAISEKFHLIYISKPGIPAIAKASELKPDYTYADSTGNFPDYYLQRNYLDYYVNRNTEIIKQLQKLSWVSKDQLAVAGHSEGATIAAKLSLENKSVTHLIFASGNPMGRIMSMIERSRKYENDSTNLAENDFGYWEYLLNENEKKDSIDPYAKTDYSFSIPAHGLSEKIKNSSFDHLRFNRLQHTLSMITSEYGAHKTKNQILNSNHMLVWNTIISERIQTAKRITISLTGTRLQPIGTIGFWKNK
jgi:hypothetical protein